MTAPHATGSAEDVFQCIQREVNMNLTEQTTDAITVWVVEDDEFFRSTIATLLEETPGFTCNGMYGTAEEAIRALQGGDVPEVVLMDIGLPGMDGIEAVKQVKAISPATDVIILTIKEGDQEVFNAICAGADGYLLKNLTPEEIIQALNEVLRGGAPMNAQIARKVLTMFTKFVTPETDYGLSARERTILKLLTEGLTKRQIAEKLFLAPTTIETHSKNIYSKLQVHSRSEAVAKALKEKLL
jgi:DNA-binding NarL/FixJ family response regulator